MNNNENNIEITKDMIERYHYDLLRQMLLQGATQKEISLIKEETIINSIKNNRKPRDVAWALLQ